MMAVARKERTVTEDDMIQAAHLFAGLFDELKSSLSTSAR